MGQNETFEAIRGAIGERVRDAGAELGKANPKTIGVVLAGAALWPIVVPLLGTGATVTAIGTGLSLLEQPGRKFVTDLVKRIADRGIDPKGARTTLETDLADRLGADDADGAALRGDVGRLLNESGGVRSALEAAPDEVKDAFAQGLADLSEQWKEFRWILGEVQLRLQDIQRRQSEGLAMQRASLDLQREQLVKTTLLLQRQVAPVTTTPLEAAAGPVAPELGEAPADGICPYKGLLAFQAEDAEFFFGREALLADVIARLSEARFVAVVGASGSGKSSFVRAGLLAAIWKGALPGSPAAQVLVMTPGEHPLEQLALRIGLHSGVAGGSILDDLRTDPARLVLAVRQMLIDAPPDVRLVLLVDQFEELFTLCHDEAERRAFVDALLAVHGDPDCPVVLVLAMRADFYGRLPGFPALARAVQDHQALVGRMSSEDLRRAIELPAAAAGLTLEAGLVDAMLDDLGEEPGALPLLSHALLETWRRRRANTMTLEGYHESGGVGGAIAQTAESVVGELDDAQRALARRVFLGLTEVGESAEPTRRRVESDEFVVGGATTSQLRDLLDVLASARLITLGEDTVEVSHEALIRHWPTLRRWLEEDGESLRVQRRLLQASQEWERAGRDPSALYRGARLVGAGEWAQEHPDELSDQTRRFLDASRAAELAELEAARRRTRRLKAVAAGMGVLCVIAAVSAFVAIGQTAKARSQQRLALSGGLTTQAISVLEQDPGRAALLGLEAYRLRATDKARDAILTALPRLGRANGELTGRKGGDQVLAFSPDGRRLATGAQDGVQLWDVATRAPVGGVLNADVVEAMSFSSDGRRLAVGGVSGVRVWDLRTRTVISTPVRGSLSTISGLAFSPDGELLAIARGAEAQAIVWDLAKDRRDGMLVHAHGAHTIQFSRDSKSIVTVAEDGRARFWNSRSHKPSRGSVRVGRNSDAALSPDGATIAIEDDAHVRLRRLSDGRQLGRALGKTVYGGNFVSPPGNATFSADGHTLGYVDHGKVRLWSVPDRRPLGPPLSVGKASAGSMAFSADGTTVATADDETVRLWNIAPPPRLSRTLSAKDSRNRPSFSPSHAITRVAFAPGGGVVAAASNDNTVRLWDTARGGRPGAVLDGPVPTAMVSDTSYGFSDVQFAPDGRTLAAASYDGTTLFWHVDRNPLHVTSRGRTGEPEIGPASVKIAFSRDGSRLAIGDLSALILLGRNVATLRSRAENGTSLPRVAFGPGNLLAEAQDHRIVLYDTSSGKQDGKPLVGHSEEVSDFAFSADGARLASVSGDKQAIVWDVASRKPAAAELVHPQAINGVALGNRVLATAGQDDAARVWSLARRTLIGAPLDTGAPVTSVALDPKSGTLATGSEDGGVRLWDPLLFSDDVAALRKRVCTATRRNLSRAEWKQLVPGEPYHETCPDA